MFLSTPSAAGQRASRLAVHLFKISLRGKRSRSFAKRRGELMAVQRTPTPPVHAGTACVQYVSGFLKKKVKEIGKKWTHTYWGYGTLSKVDGRSKLYPLQAWIQSWLIFFPYQHMEHWQILQDIQISLYSYSRKMKMHSFWYNTRTLYISLIQ